MVAQRGHCGQGRKTLITRYPFCEQNDYILILTRLTTLNGLSLSALKENHIDEEELTNINNAGLIAANKLGLVVFGIKYRKLW